MSLSSLTPCYSCYHTHCHAHCHTHCHAHCHTHWHAHWLLVHPLTHIAIKMYKCLSASNPPSPPSLSGRVKCREVALHAWSTPIWDRLFSFTTTNLLKTFKHNDRKNNKMAKGSPTDFHKRFLFINLVQKPTCSKYRDITEILFFLGRSIHLGVGKNIANLISIIFL